MAQDKIIMYDSPEAAQQVTLTGWVSGGDKRFWYKDEHMARWSGCTHKLCDCGNVMSKNYTKCESCIAKANRERYLSYPFKTWNGEPVCTPDGHKYFFNEEDLIEYMDEEELDTIDLLFCEENHWSQVSDDYWSDMMPDNGDGELPDELQKALDNLNKVVSSLPPQSYSPGKIRTTFVHVIT